MFAAVPCKEQNEMLPNIIPKKKQESQQQNDGPTSIDDQHTTEQQTTNTEVQQDATIYDE